MSDRIAEDMEALGALGPRFAGTDGERAALDAVTARLPQPELARVEGFAGHTLPWLVLGMHGVCAFAAGLVGLWWPLWGALGCLGTAASLAGEGTGTVGLLRLWLPRQSSYNLVVPHPRPGALGSVVVCTPLDAPRTHVRRPAWVRRPLLFVFASTVVLGVVLALRWLSEPWGTPLLSLYVLSLVVTGVASVVVIATLRKASAEPADPGGMATLLALERHWTEEPLGGLEVWTVFTGCGRAHQDGIRTFLHLRARRLPAPVLLVSLTDVGRAPLQAARTEGPLFRQHHLATGAALVERLQWAGVRIPAVDRPEASDARAAGTMGIRALSLVGGKGPPDPDAVRRAAALTDTLLRWYAEDLARVGASGVVGDEVAPPAR
ncbi:MAG: hypothetical protein H6732_08890 [Alphaproteobacteria bacterium]|nr:hypothetical protein [Alphaproteobacteria bacterium]